MIEIRHKKDFYMDGKNQLLLIREISGDPPLQVPSDPITRCVYALILLSSGVNMGGHDNVCI